MKKRKEITNNTPSEKGKVKVKNEKENDSIKIAIPDSSMRLSSKVEENFTPLQYTDPLKCSFKQPNSTPIERLYPISPRSTGMKLPHISTLNLPNTSNINLNNISPALYPPTSASFLIPSMQLISCDFSTLSATAAESNEAYNRSLMNSVAMNQAKIDLDFSPYFPCKLEYKFLCHLIYFLPQLIMMKQISYPPEAPFSSEIASLRDLKSWFVVLEELGSRMYFPFAWKILHDTIALCISHLNNEIVCKINEFDNIYGIGVIIPMLRNICKNDKCAEICIAIIDAIRETSKTLVTK